MQNSIENFVPGEKRLHKDSTPVAPTTDKARRASQQGQGFLGRAIAGCEQLCVEVDEGK